MNLFDSLILNIVLLAFPIILWLFYMTHNKNVGKTEKELLIIALKCILLTME